MMDAEILRRALSGERSAVDRLGRWLTDELYATFSRRHDVQDVWELTQATSERVLTNLQQAPTEFPAFRAWIHGFAGNALNREMTEMGRERARRAKLLIHLVERELEPSVDLEAEFGEQEMRAFLDRQIEELPRSYQTVLSMRLRDYSMATIAARSDITPGTARRYQWLAIRRLRKAIEQERATRSRYRSPAS